MSDEQAGTRIDLEWSVMWCARHLEPYRAGWPKGAAVAMMRLFDAAVKMPAIAGAAGNDTGALQAALERFAPVCCFVGADVLAAIYAETGVA